jgi:hypothetical protein
VIKEGRELSDPWLYMSPFFDENRYEYIDQLFRISTEGDWEGWIEFCLRETVLMEDVIRADPLPIRSIEFY